MVAEQDAPVTTSLSIENVRRQLRGGVERFDHPLEPMIPSGDWEMLSDRGPHSGHQHTG